jgi:hypothetical protein
MDANGGLMTSLARRGRGRREHSIQLEAGHPVREGPESKAKLERVAW